MFLRTPVSPLLCLGLSLTLGCNDSGGASDGKGGSSSEQSTELGAGGGDSENGKAPTGADPGFDWSPPDPAGDVDTTLVHPGMVHKQSDLQRMKYMVEAKLDPWYSSFLDLADEDKASYDYVVLGNTSMTEVYRDVPEGESVAPNKAEWESDSKAAYFNALMWAITGDDRHAEKAIEIFNAWTGLTYVQHTGTKTLTGSMVFVMLEAAEIIKSTYDGWSGEDQKKFGDMLVYPGYSSTSIPDDLETQGTWYWRVYMGDRHRAGNQEASGWRACMAIGIFLDNEIIYDRAYRYVANMKHRADDMPYEPGPTIAGEVITETPYNIAYRNIHQTTEEDYGYDGVLVNYILETGQCGESSRDQGHSMWGINCIQYMAEMAWSQGDDLYGHADSRLLKGLEYHSRYNLSYLRAYTDQSEPWEPTVESGEYISALNRCARTKSKAINPYFEYTYDGSSVSRGAINGYMWEMSVGHYVGRGFADSEIDAKWITRTRDYNIETRGYEPSDRGGAYLGWGGLTLRRPAGCHGDPIVGFYSNGQPAYEMNVVPTTIEAEHYDYSPVEGEARTYHDTTEGNSGVDYRAKEAVDIEARKGGGYRVGQIEDGEWLTYTIYIPETGSYDVSLSYSAEDSGGSLSVVFDEDKQSAVVNLTSTGGDQVYEDATLASGIALEQGVQSMKLLVTEGGFALDSITIE